MKNLKFTLLTFLLLAVPFAAVHADGGKPKPKVKVDVAIRADDGALVTKIKSKEKETIVVVITVKNAAGEEVSKKSYTLNKGTTTKSELYLNLDVQEEDYNVDVEVENYDGEVDMSARIIGPSPEYTIKLGKNGICFKKD